MRAMNEAKGEEVTEECRKLLRIFIICFVIHETLRMFVTFLIMNQTV